MKRQQITDILVTKISRLPPVASVCKGSHTQATVTAGYVCAVIVRNPDLFRITSDGMEHKETVLLFSYTCATDTNIVELFQAPSMFLVPQSLWTPKMNPVCTREPKRVSMTL